MGELKIVLSQDVEAKFRRLAMARYGYVKGALSRAMEEIIKSHIKSNDGGELTKEDMWDDLAGCMKHVKKGSVQLQHEIGDYIAEKYSKKSKKRK